MHVARLTRPYAPLPTAYLATKAQHPIEGDYKATLRIISYLNGWKSTTANSNFTYMAMLLGYPTMMAAVSLDGSLNSASPSWG